MADAGDSKSPALPGCVGSTPTSGTTRQVSSCRSPSHRAVDWKRAPRGTLLPMMNTAVRTLLLFALATGCSASAAKRPAAAPAPPKTSATPTLMSEEPPALTPQELIGLERTPGSTPPLPQGVEPAPAAVAGLGGIPGPSPACGPEDAPVRIYLFTDFQCPVCPRVVEPIKHLARAYPNDVRIVLKENPLPIHNRAARLAAASLAALRQGKFWELHDRLFSGDRRFEDSDLITYAQALGLDVARFRHDMDDEAVVEQVKYESELAKSIDLGSTPGLIVNGTRHMGWGSYMSLENVVKQELARARKIAQGGVPAGRVAYEATRQSGPNGERLAAALFTVTK
jgi:protein-disulfide isomerase